MKVAIPRSTTRSVQKSPRAFTACDACNTRRIKCKTDMGQSECNGCKDKSSKCTYDRKTGRRERRPKSRVDVPHVAERSTNVGESALPREHQSHANSSLGSIDTAGYMNCNTLTQPESQHSDYWKYGHPDTLWQWNRPVGLVDMSAGHANATAAGDQLDFPVYELGAASELGIGPSWVNTDPQTFDAKIQREPGWTEAEITQYWQDVRYDDATNLHHQY